MDCLLTSMTRDKGLKLLANIHANALELTVTTFSAHTTLFSRGPAISAFSRTRLSYGNKFSLKTCQGGKARHRRLT